MANNFIVTLDTTPPVTILTIPYSSLVNAPIDIVIESNEQLLNTQNFYFIDSTNTRVECILFISDDNKRFYGRVTPIGLTPGVVTFVYVVKDIVGNENHSEKTLMIGSTHLIPKITFAAKTRTTNFISKTRTTNYISKTRTTNFISR